MGKKIYIVTLGAQYMFSNVGTFLQHWALRKTLSEMGHDPKRVAWEGDKNHIAINYYRLVITFFIYIVKVILHYIGIKQNKFEKYNLFSFRDLIQARLYRRCFISNIGDCIENTNIKCDLLVLGGDQVMDINYFDLMSNVNASKYISYAASTDWEKNSKLSKWKNTISCNLSTFSKVGVRESMGVQSLKELGIQATRVADPVMLLASKDLNNFAGNKCVFRNSSMFVYLLNISKKSDLNIDGLSFLSKTLGVELYLHGIQGAQYLIPNKYYKHLDPCEFVRAIRDCEYYITNSYHGTVLALMFHKPFVCIMQDNEDVITQNVRQKELLDLIELQHHRIRMNDLSVKGETLLKEQIDWVKIDQKLNEFRLFSLNWLKDAIEN